MLETSEERVKLLKAGIFGKTIERLYIKYNNFKIIGSPMLIESIRVGTRQNKNNPISQEAVAEMSL